MRYVLLVLPWRSGRRVRTAGDRVFITDYAVAMEHVRETYPGGYPVIMPLDPEL